MATGPPDLVMLGSPGIPRAVSVAHEQGGVLKLLPPERIFMELKRHVPESERGRAGRSGRRKVELVDWDGDGDLDLITDSDEGPIWYENTGSQAKPVMALRGKILKAENRRPQSDSHRRRLEW